MEEYYGNAESIECKHKTYTWRINAEQAASHFGTSVSNISAGRKKVPALGNQIHNVWIYNNRYYLPENGCEYSRT